MYGWHGNYHLNAMMKEKEEEEKWREYCATAIWSVGRLLGGEGYPIPAYSDFIDPKPQDMRSSEAIVTNLVDKLMKGGEEQK